MTSPLSLLPPSPWTLQRTGAPLPLHDDKSRQSTLQNPSREWSCEATLRAFAHFAPVKFFEARMALISNFRTVCCTGQQPSNGTQKFGACVLLLDCLSPWHARTATSKRQGICPWTLSSLLSGEIFAPACHVRSAKLHSICSCIRPVRSSLSRVDRLQVSRYHCKRAGRWGPYHRLRCAVCRAPGQLQVLNLLDIHQTARQSSISNTDIVDFLLMALSSITAGLLVLIGVELHH